MNLKDLFADILAAERADPIAKERHRRLDIEADLRMSEESKLHDGWCLIEFNADIALLNWQRENPDYIPEEQPSSEQFVEAALGYGLTPSVTKPGWFIAPPTYHA